MVRPSTVHVIGVAPGLNALAYAVIEAGDATLCVDHDVLHARPLSVESIRNPYKRSRIHQMVLGVVAERYPPALLVVGPVADPKEEPDHVQASRDVLAAMAVHFRVPIETIDSREAVLAAHGTGIRSMGRSVNRCLDEPLDSRDRRIVLAAAAALSGLRMRMFPVQRHAKTQ